MRKKLIVGAVLLSVGCASGGGVVPFNGVYEDAIATAQDRLAAAQAAGADSLAIEAMQAARQNIAAAQVEKRNNNSNRATLKARLAQADATYARIQSERVMSERAQAQSRAALAALPPSGGAQ